MSNEELETMELDEEEANFDRVYEELEKVFLNSEMDIQNLVDSVVGGILTFLVTFDVATGEVTQENRKKKVKQFEEAFKHICDFQQSTIKSRFKDMLAAHKEFTKNVPILH